MSARVSIKTAKVRLLMGVGRLPGRRPDKKDQKVHDSGLGNQLAEDAGGHRQEAGEAEQVRNGGEEEV